MNALHTISGKNFIWFVNILFGLFLLCHCSTEEIFKLPVPEGDATIELRFPTSRGLGDSDSNDEVLNQVRMIVFRSNSTGAELGTPYLNKVYTPLVSDSPDEITITEIVPAGYLNIYLIGNEQSSMNLPAITNSASLSGKIVDYTSSIGSYVSPPFVMYSFYKAVHVGATGTITHQDVIKSGGKTTFPIKRTASKLTVHVNCDFVNLGGRAIMIDSAMVVSMPSSSWLLPREYTGSTFFSTQRLDLTSYIVDKMTGPLVTGFETKQPPAGGGFTFYLPEHLINRSDRSHFTYLRLVGHVANPPASKLVYRIPLGDGLTANTAAHLLKNYATVPAADLTVSRNIHYEMKIDIRGLGELNDVEVWVEVKPWDIQDIDGSHNVPYLNVSTVSAAVNSFVTQRIYFWTNRTDSVYLEPIGKVGTTGGTDFTVNNTFYTVAGHTPYPANFVFNAATFTGYFDIVLNPASTTQPTRYLVYLRSGKLRREIEIFASNVAAPNTTRW
jgi:hypothetical protein